MEQIKIQSLLSYLGETEETVEIDFLKHDDNKTIYIDNAEYSVLTEEEVKEEFYNYQMVLIDDMGLEAFADWAKDEILNYHTTQDYKQVFDEIMEESQQALIEDLRYMGELENEMEMAGRDTEDDFLEYLCQEDSIEWFIMTYGEDEHQRIIKDNDLIDWDSVIEWVEQTDGRSCLAGYDGNELELDNGLFAYRTN